MSSNNQRSKAFTVTSNGGIFRELKTDCGICPGFKPQKGIEHPDITRTIGIWDTGATNCAIDKKLAHELNLKPSGTTIIHHADGSSEVSTYFINLFLPNGVAFSLINVSEADLNNAGMLIGMDIISKGDFSVTNVDGNTTFSFRVPSQERIDYVEDSNLKYHTPVTVKADPPRNSLCPCGSGKKFKHCCAGK